MLRRGAVERERHGQTVYAHIPGGSGLSRGRPGLGEHDERRRADGADSRRHPGRGGIVHGPSPRLTCGNADPQDLFTLDKQNLRSGGAGEVMVRTGSAEVRLRARVVVGADGSASVVARSLRGGRHPRADTSIAIRGYAEGPVRDLDRCDICFSGELGSGAARSRGTGT